MTPFSLSQSTIDAINAAINNPPTSGTTDRTLNAAAYRAIYSELVQQNTNGNTIAPEVLYWFQHAPEIHEQQTTASAAGTFIWAYTKAAAVSEGVTLTNDDLQASSDAIALAVFSSLKAGSFSFDSTDGSEDNFSIAGIINKDASAGIDQLRVAHPTLDFAVWGGTLFATTNLGYATYFTKFGVDQTPGSRDATAILNGLAGAIATLSNVTHIHLQSGAVAIAYSWISANDNFNSSNRKIAA